MMEKRISNVEKDVAVLDNRQTVSEHRIRDLEKEMKEFRTAMARNQGGIAILVIVVPLLVQFVA